MQTRMSIRPNARVRLVDEPLQLLLGRNVGGDGDRRLVAAGAIDRGCDLRAGLRLARGDHDLRAVLGEPLGDRAADAARRAGDDRDAPGQVEKAGQGFLPMRRSVRLDIFHGSIRSFQANPSRAKPFCLVLFVRIGTYQWVTAIPIWIPFQKIWISFRPACEFPPSDLDFLPCADGRGMWRHRHIARMRAFRSTCGPSRPARLAARGRARSGAKYSSVGGRKRVRARTCAVAVARLAVDIKAVRDDQRPGRPSRASSRHRAAAAPPRFPRACPSPDRRECSRRRS